MIRINLLPFRAARTKENVRRQVSTFLLIFAMIFFLLFFGSLQVGYMRSRLKDKVQASKVELDKYTQKAKEVDDLTKENEMIEKKINIINDLEKLRKEPVTLLASLTELIVEDRMWLTNFEIKDKDLLIKGMALDEITVADFAKRMQGSGLYGEIVLKNLKQAMLNNIKMKTFEITGTINRLNEKKPATNKALK